MSMVGAGELLLFCPRLAFLNQNDMNKEILLQCRINAEGCVVALKLLCDQSLCGRIPCMHFLVGLM